MKLIRSLLFKLGFFIIFVFVMELIGVYPELFGFDLIKIQYASILVGIGFIFLVPEYFLSFKEYQKKYGECDFRRASYWIFSLTVGFFCIIIPFFVK